MGKTVGTAISKKGSAASAPKQLRPSREEISARAYAIYLANGGQHGRDQQDWFEAERLLMSARATLPTRSRK
jgi:hypothetical protein